MTLGCIRRFSTQKLILKNNLKNFQFKLSLEISYLHNCRPARFNFLPGGWPRKSSCWGQQVDRRAHALSSHPKPAGYSDFYYILTLFLVRTSVLQSRVQWLFIQNYSICLSKNVSAIITVKAFWLKGHRHEIF